MRTPPAGTTRARAVVAIGLLAGCLCALPAAPHAVPQRRDARVTVAVLDRNEAPVTGLGPGDFVVREDGIAREVLRVEGAAPPSHLVLLIDNSQATNALTLDLREGLKRFVELIGSGGAIPSTRLVTFGDRPATQVEFTTSTSRVLEGVDRLFPLPGAGGTFLEAVIETARDLRVRAAERPVIVAFVAEAGPEFSDDRHTNVADALREAGASLWVVPLQARTGQDLSEPGKERSIVVGDVTRQSGGLQLPVLSREGVTRAFETVARVLGSRYDVVYGRPDALLPPTRIAVTTRNSAHTVLASQWVRP
jgi:hypothetical protein